MALVYPTLISKDFFRVLELFPGSGQLICRLHCRKIGDACLQYEALSYVWGIEDPRSEVFLQCNDADVAIKPNLASALQHIRHGTQSRWLWVDALCINQKNADERSQQVMLMGDIYANAARVLVWIGEDHLGEAEECFALIEATINYLDRQLVEHGGIDRIPAISAECGNVCAESTKWDLVRRLVDSEWFTRVWVLQEIGLARAAIILYGRSSMNWSQIVELLLFSAERADFGRLTGNIKSGQMWDVFDGLLRTFGNRDTWRNDLPLLKSLNQSSPNEQTLVDILACTRGYSASDQRDRVYAFSAHPLAYGIVSADYEKPLDEVYAETAARMLARGDHSWTVLSSVDRPLDASSIKDDWPSWVPRWDEGWTTYWLGYPTMYYRASASLAGNFEGNLASKRLHVRGIVLDEITWASKVFTSEGLRIEEQEKTQPLQWLWKDLRSHIDLPGVYGNIESQYEIAFSLVIAAGRAMDDGAAEQDLDFHKAVYGSYKTRVSAGKAASLDELPQELERHMLTYVSNQRRALHNRRAFYTQQGYLGIGPASLQVSDVCVVIRGANVPFVLRKIPAEDNETACYKLIGESYVQGIMNGEVMAMAHDDGKGDIVERRICIV